MPSPWNDATDRKLLLVIIQQLSPSPPKWDEVAMAMGEGFTAESVRQHYKKMRKDPGGVQSSPSKSTPTKKGQAKSSTNNPTAGTKTNGGRKKRKIAAMLGLDDILNGDDDDDDEDVKFLKKPMIVKIEDEENVDQEFS